MQKEKKVQLKIAGIKVYIQPSEANLIIGEREIEINDREKFCYLVTVPK